MARLNVDGFTKQELDYYSRQIMLKNMGLEGQRKIKKSTVCIVGVGGLGSPIAIQLASMGVGCLRLVDNDIVEISNLQRQHIYGVDQIGLPKVEAAAQRLKQVNPFIEIETLPLMVTPKNAEKIIQGSDVVIGSLDRMAPRYSLNRACQKLGVPFIHGAGLAYNGSLSTIIPEKTACLECFYGGINDDEMPTCATVGIHPSVLGIVGSLVSSETIRIITGQKPEMTDILMFIDLEDYSFNVINVRKVDTCPVCGKEGGKPTPVKHEAITEICGREGRRVFIYDPEEPTELDLSQVEAHVAKLGYSVRVRGELGLSFEGEGDIKGSVLISGIVILEGFDEMDASNKVHQEILRK